MRTLLYRRAIAIAGAFLATAALADLHGPYWGTWDPDPTASTHSKTLKAAFDPNAPPAPPAAPAAIAEKLPPLRINDDGPDFTFEYLEDDGSVISSTKITVDGKENVNTRAGGALIHRSTSRWEGSTLRTSWRLEQPGGAVVISGTDRWDFIHPDTLRLAAETEDAKSTSRSLIVYQRRRHRAEAALTTPSQFTLSRPAAYSSSLCRIRNVLPGHRQVSKRLRTVGSQQNHRESYGSNRSVTSAGSTVPG